MLKKIFNIKGFPRWILLTPPEEEGGFGQQSAFGLELQHHLDARLHKLIYQLLKINFLSPHLTPPTAHNHSPE